MSGLLVQLGAQVVPLHRCSWYFVASCGCTYGVMLADLNDARFGSREVFADEERAWAHFTPNKVQRDRDRAAGERAELGLSSEIKERVMLTCPHTPQWGREVTPVPDGYTWACTERAPRSKHFVKGEPLSDEDHRGWLEPRGEKRPTLCRRTQNKYWRASPYVLGDLPECLPCAAKAKEWHEAHVAVGPLDGCVS